VSERIRSRASEISLLGCASHHRFTVSAGIASFPGGSTYDSDSLLHQADQALLKAKASGKNRTVVAGAMAVFAHEQASMTGAGRILIVEDEPNNQVLLQKVLTRMGYQWDCVANGEEAVARAAAESYALVLMDLSLPGIDGWQATRSIRESGNATPIIATSAHAMAADKALAAAAGCNEYITKPYNLAELRRTIERYVPLCDTDRSET
ncbi:MAG: response regulator, partial [Chloroflexi bacterium]|nr:response regulator [Chloroflexota bacterium]